jgi:uncharacterized protein
MKKLKEFDIDFDRLEEKTYQFQYKINSDFFSFFEYSIVQNGNLEVNLTLTKTATLLDLNFNIKGFVVLVCDRSLEEFEFPIAITNKLIAKLSDKFEELTDELITIDRSESVVNVAQFIYEYIALEIPMKKLHPKFQDEDESEENDILIYSSEKKDGNENESPDPRWEALKKLNKN